MEYRLKSADVTKLKSHCIILPVYDKNRLTASGQALDKATGGKITRILKEGDLSGKVGQTLLIHDPDNIDIKRILLAGFGDAGALDADKYRQAVEACAGVMKKIKAKNAVCCLSEVEVKERDAYFKIRSLIETFEDQFYTFTNMKGTGSLNNNGPSISQVDILLAESKDKKLAKKGLDHATGICKGIAVTKNLGNTPGNICNPTYLAKEAKNLSKTFPAVKTSVIEEKDMRRLGMGALLSVSQGSEEPAKLIVMQYKGAGSTKKPFVFVGKGITFDSGGISLKPGAGMNEMIYDMCGAASVMGVMTAIAELRLPVNVVGVISAAENMPSGTASRPGDIVTSMSGQTIEILNTDAEGRLVLSDALTYIEKYNPETVIDIATLTGACVIALGAHASALYANNEDLANNLLQASEKSMDKVWRMPLWEEYQKQIDSNVADMANTGGREAGSVTAACFLARFTRKYKWAHLDIAGTAWKTGGQKTATGRPVTLLMQYILDKM